MEPERPEDTQTNESTTAGADKTVDPQLPSSTSDLPQETGHHGLTSNDPSPLSDKPNDSGSESGGHESVTNPADGAAVLSTLPSSLPGYLPWEDDMEMVSKYLDRKDELEQSHQQYLSDNPELKAVLADFLQAVLIQKPDNIFSFAQQFFRPFGPRATQDPSFPSFKPETN